MARSLWLQNLYFPFGLFFNYTVVVVVIIITTTTTITTIINVLKPTEICEVEIRRKVSQL